MSKNYFIFKGQRYYIETIVKIKESQKNFFGFYTRVIFSRYDDNRNLYCFSPLGEPFREFKITEEQIPICIEEIGKGVVCEPVKNKKMDPKYIDGMFNAWIWYILIMLFALFTKGTIVLWVFASVVFFKWRNDKINGR